MKAFQKGSIYESYDRDGDGIITDDEMAQHERIIMIENEDKKQDAQRNMAWFALGGMLLYPFAVVLAVFLHLEQAAKILGDMAATYFVSVAAIVAAFYGKEALASRSTTMQQTTPAPRPVINRPAIKTQSDEN